MFTEDKIKFPPTYKFKLNSDDYDLSKVNRIPSYCDRVLFKLPTKNLFCQSLGYNNISSFKQSDHRPVYAVFEIKTIDFNNYEPPVLFLNILANKSQNLEINYQIQNSCITHFRDWIGLYDVSNSRNSFDLFL